MNTQPLISVVIPCYNAEQYLEDAINSILTQTYENIEIIAIDNASQDGTLEILKTLQARDKRIVVVANERNLGLIKSLNIGVEKARGLYIARMDADDISMSFRLEKQRAFIEKKGLDLISSAFIEIDKKGNRVRGRNKKFAYPGACLYQSFFSNPIVHPALLAKADVLKRNMYGKLDALCTEDFELWNRLAIKGYKIGNMEEPLIFYRRTEESVSVKYEQLQVKNHVAISRERIESYFGIKMNNTTALVANNRVHNECQIIDYFNALKVLNVMKERIKQATTNLEERKEIDNVYYFQVLDIAIQSILKVKFKLKLVGCFLLLIHSYTFIYPEVRAYIRSKI